MMLALLTAKKFRKGRSRSGMISLISIISTLSIAVGIAALIIGLSAMNGFQRELSNRVLSVVPHGQFYSQKGYLSNWRDIQSKLQKNKHIVSATPFIQFSALLENGSKLSAISVQAVDLKQEQQFSLLPNYVLNNKWRDFSPNREQIIIGAGLAKTLSVEEGGFVTLLIPVSSSDNQLKAPMRVRLYVAGILDLNGSLSNNIAILPLDDAQQLLSMSDNVTGVKVTVDDVFNAEQIIYQAGTALKANLFFSSWERSYGYMYRDIQMIRQVMYLAMIIVIGVASFNIVSTLVIAVKDKQRDIAILKTLGAPDKFIRHIFIWYGALSGLFGSILGVALGVVVSLDLPAIIERIESLFHYKLLNSHIYFIDFLPSEIHFFDVVLVFITAMVLSLIASYYPAQRACKVDPARVLNGF